MLDLVFLLRFVKHYIQNINTYYYKNLETISGNKFNEIGLANFSYIFLFPITLWVNKKKFVLQNKIIKIIRCKTINYKI